MGTEPATGFSWFTGSLNASDQSLLFTLGYACGALTGALLLHLILAFPSGNEALALGFGLVALTVTVGALLSTIVLVVVGTTVHAFSRFGEDVFEWLTAAAYYLVAEALTNVAKFAQASVASVRVVRENRHVLVEIVDDGIGGADSSRGSGLRGLADRVEALDGRLELHSPPGAGTRIRAEIPCGSNCWN